MTTKGAETPQSGIAEMYAGRDFVAGPATYTNQEFFQKISNATSLDRATKQVRVLDSMSGPGLVGSGLQKLAPRHRYFYLDLVPTQLAKIDGAEGKVAGDARQIPFTEKAFQVGVVRYAAKDIPQNQQAKLFEEMHRVTARRGRWVLADMYAPNPDVYEWLNWQHAMKQERSGRNRQTEGTCHIPTEEGWLELFRKTGFRAEVVDKHMSFVTTTDWLKSNQVTAEQLNELNRMILTAPDAVKTAFNIREEDGSVKINYPVTIIRATKP